MKATIRIALVASALLSLGAEQKGIVYGEAGEDPVEEMDARASQRWALLVGIDQYEDDSIVDLDYAANDARAMAAQLIESGTYAADHVLVMTPDADEPDLRPSRDNILAKLAWLESLRAAETVLFFYSGHGAAADNPDGTRSNYLFPQNTKKVILKDTAITMDRLMESLNAVEAERRFVILDACRNKLGARQKALPEAWDDERYAAEGTMVLYGTEFGGYSYEDPEAELGALTAYLIEGMEGHADGLSEAADGVVSANELFAYASEKLQIRGQGGEFQVPYRGGEWRGEDFPVVASGMYIRAAPEAEADRWVGATGYAMVRVPAGGAVIGSPYRDPAAADDERRHDVALQRDVWLGEVEVTQALWQEVTGERPMWDRRELWDGETLGECGVYKGQRLVGPELPVACVSWCEAVAFANAISEKEGLAPAYRGVEECGAGGVVSWNRRANGYRLPTEAEWEIAARAGTSGRYPGGVGADQVCDHGNVADESTSGFGWGWQRFSCDDGYRAAAAVGSFRPNELDLFDMTGNVWEWTWDGYRADYWNDVAVDPAGHDTSALRVIRGGSWYSAPERARLAAREPVDPENRAHHVGLRLARTAE